MNKLNVLVIGGGMYVSGRGTDGNGTIFPALLEAKKKNFIDRIYIATTSKKTAILAFQALKKLSKLMKVDFDSDYMPKEDYNFNSYKDALKIFKPDAVIISVPDHLHSKIATEALKLNKHCLVVKPMASTYIEAKKMLKAAISAKVVAEVEFHKRLDESNLLLKDSIDKGKIGNLLYVVIEYSQQKNIPEKIFKKWSDKTNIFSYLGVHYVDLLYFVTGYKPISVTAWGQKSYLKNRGINTWDSIQVVIVWNKKNKEFVSTHLTNWIDSNKSTALSDQKINIVGTKGRYQADQKNRGISLTTDANGSQEINPYFSSYTHNGNKSISYNGYGIKNIVQFIHDVINFKNRNVSLKELDKFRPTFKASMVSMAVLEAAKKSLKNKSKKVLVKL